MKNLLIFTLLFSSLGVFSQKKISPQKLLGSYSLESIDNVYPDGRRVYPYGKKPSGLLFFEKNGSYAIQILSEVRPTIVSTDKNNLTPEEYASIVKAFNSHYGTYEINSEEKTIKFNINHASYPKWENTVQERSFTFSQGTLKYVVTRTTQGGDSVVAEVVWKKL